MKGTLIIAVAIVGAGCTTFRVAKDEFDVGFHAAEKSDGVHAVRYNGEAMESPASLERNLRRGVHALCGGDGYTLAGVRVDEDTVMHRWQPRFRYVSAVATCG